mgnify:CR=1 FL=1
MVDKDGVIINQQTDADVRYLDPMDHVRLRPGMYVGGVDSRALHHLIYEVVDNSIDEVLAGRCDHIIVTLHDDNVVSVADNGGGIPVGLNQDTGLPTLQVVMTKIGAGGKFGSDAYKVSGGLHGVGVSAVNALSEELSATVFRDGHEWRQMYRSGAPTTGVEQIRKLEPGEHTGTLVSFKPDFSVMDFNEFSYATLVQRFREMAFVTRRVTLTLRDERIRPFPRETTFYFEGGIASFVRYLNRNREGLHPVVYAERDVDFKPENKSPYTIGVEVAFQYTDTANVTELAFANTINTPDGGTHLTGLRSAITSVINRYARKAGLLKEKDPNFSGSDTLEGITAVVSVKHPQPSFESQTKVKLINAETQGAVSQVVSDIFGEFLETNPREARKIVEKCMTSMRAREAARKARDLVRSGPSLLESSTLPGKLADCSQIGENAELYLVEGDSAGGCFSGDTLIALADGRHLSFIELLKEQAGGHQNYCYTIRNDGKIGLEKIVNVRMTKRNASVIRLILDNGETIVCTPDHRFMLRDGTYQSAESLTNAESLMPLYRKLSDTSEIGTTNDGYEMVWNPQSETWLFTHTLADRYNRGRGVEHTRAYFASHPEARRNALARTYYHKTMAGLKTVELAHGFLDVDAYQAHQLQTRDKSLLRFDSFCHRYFEGDMSRVREAVSNYNHRVVKIERLDSPVDVYDLEVPYTHNFALASGVFVHNSAKQGRDRHFQAILPLRGKILNTERARMDKMLDNNEIKSLISALGTGISDDFDTSRLRYDRIIIMTDADVDGSHIRTLLLTFFFRHMQGLIQEGHLYIAQPPIFRIVHGKESEYIYGEAGMTETEILNRALAPYKDPEKLKISRYKGLGEMNPEQLWETTMDPARRTLLQVTIDDAAEADRVFDMLMGSAVPPRRRFIQTHARSVRNLDV